MNINDIRLPDQLLVELYRDSLIETGENPAKLEPLTVKMEPVASSGWKSLGNNKKNILIITSNTNSIHLPDKELGFLTTMLGACKLGLDDVALVNLNNHPGTTYKELFDFFRSRIVLLFDVEPADFGLPMKFPHYQLQAFANATFLYAPSLTELETDKLQKSKLWVSLKRLFNL